MKLWQEASSRLFSPIIERGMRTKFRPLCEPAVISREEGIRNPGPHDGEPTLASVQIDIIA